jgi:uroporphyrinogen decarboxylase
MDSRTVVETEEDLVGFSRNYDASLPGRFHEDWERLIASWRARDYALIAAPWNEGLFQVMGVSDGATLYRAMVVLCEQPWLVEALMERYGDFLEALIPRVLAEIEIDYALFYEPIAWTHAPVISPDDYARFALPTLKRVVAQLEDCGVAHRVVRATGEVRPIIPLWLDAGINGLMITQTGATGIRYPELRREYGRELRLFGGIDSRAVLKGPAAIDRALEDTVRPLLNEGGYVPHLDDTIRANCPFEYFTYYRKRLDALIADM